MYFANTKGCRRAISKIGKEFPYYINVNNINCKFSKMSINETILNMKDELLRTGLNRIPIYGNGWAKIDEKNALAIINRINSKSNSFYS